MNANAKALFVTCVLGASALVWVGCSGGTTTSGPTDGGGGTDASTTDGPSGGDSGSDTGAKDAGKEASTLTGPFVDLKYGAANCPAFTPCGGDAKATWNVSGGCIKEEIFDQAKAQCPTLGVENVVFQARGFVTADGTNFQRHTEVKFTAKFVVPSGCKAAIGTCSGIASAIKTLGGMDTATCADDAATGGCTCDVGNTIEEQLADTYTAAGNTITTGTGGAAARTYDYCVTGNSATFQETTGGPQPAILTGTK